MAEQQDIDNVLKLVIHDHRVAAAQDMRERAAKLVEDCSYATGRDKRWLAVEIRRLPIDPETGGE